MNLVYISNDEPRVLALGADYVHSEGTTSYESLINMGPEGRAELDPPIFALADPAGPDLGRTEVSRDLAIVDGSVVWDVVYSEIDAEVFCKLVDAERDRRIALDFAYDFGEIDAILDDGSTVEAGVRSLQMSASDRANWQTLDGLALKIAVAGGPTTILPIRCSDNANVQTTAVQVGEALTAATLRGSALLFAGAGIKAALRADPENAVAIWEAATWPS